MAYYYYNNYYYDGSHFYQHTDVPLYFWPTHSKLSPTASEFVPAQQPYANVEYAPLQISYFWSSLNVHANEFIPKHHQNNNDAVDYSQREQNLIPQLDCYLCSNRIVARQAVWSCNSCFQIVHLHCVLDRARELGILVRCPICPHDCFCGKFRSPGSNTGAQSCGRDCERIQRANCVHPCRERCHQGECPPCQVILNIISNSHTHTQILILYRFYFQFLFRFQVFVPVKCKCEGTSRMQKCSERTEFRCKKWCGKHLNCNQHLCRQFCHNGSCGSCSCLTERQGANRKYIYRYC